jgi:2-oxoglutarate dehydrogenase E2 component (dihydrolipoamide succinyltransferase)
VHLGIAVSLGEGGLIVPIIRDAQDLSVEGLAKRIKDLARRARSNQLTPDEVSGGTFTITNPGAFGSIMATPVINLPQVGILDTEAVVKRRWWSRTSSATTRSPSAMTYLCMSLGTTARSTAPTPRSSSPRLRQEAGGWPITPAKV